MIKNHHIDEEMSNLRKELNNVLDKVFLALHHAQIALYTANFDLAKKVVKEDIYINRLEVEIEKICLKIFALKQPIAYDLRFLLGVLKINNDLERIGDFASIIAKEVVTLNLSIDFLEKENKLFEALKKDFEITQNMIKNSFITFMKKDSNKARIIFFQDRDLDILYEKIYRMVIQRMKGNFLKLEIGISIINIIKGLERIGDYCKNICEQTIYLDQGEIVRYQLSLE